MNPKRLVFGTAAALLVAAGLPAAAASTAFAQQQPPVTITAAQALNMALAAVPGTVMALKLEDEDSRVAFEVEVRPQAGGPVREVQINASTGQVLGIETEDDDDTAEAARAPVAIPAAQALNAALGAVPGTVRELELGDEAGRVAWEASILPQGGGPTREVRVDAATGAVLSTMTADEDAGETAEADED